MICLRRSGKNWTSIPICLHRKKVFEKSCHPEFPKLKPHAAVYGLEIPTKDSVVEVKIKFEGATMVSVEFDDRKYTDSHYGHICYARVVFPNSVTLVDHRLQIQASNLVLDELQKKAKADLKSVPKPKF